MSLKAKIEAVIYASEEPVTLQQLVGLLADEAGAEVDEVASAQASLMLDGGEPQTSLNEDQRDLAPETMPEAVDVTEGSAEIGSDADTVSDDPVTPNSATSQQPAEEDKRRARDRDRAIREHIRRTVDRLIRDYAESERGIEIREVASGFRMGTKPEYHDAVRGFVKSLKPALKLTLPALETLAVVAYKQPVTAAEISEIRGVDSAGVLGGLMARKLIATAGRKQVIGRPMLYKTTRDFLLRFGLKDVNELPSMEEFERMAGELAEQDDLPMDNAEAVIEQANVRGDAEHILAANAPEQAVTSNTDEPEQQATAETAEGRDTHEHQEIHSAGQTTGHAQDHEADHVGEQGDNRATSRAEDQQEAEEAVTTG